MQGPSETAQPPAIVIGLDTMQGLQAARLLAARELPVIALASDSRHPACRTRVCRSLQYCDTKGSELLEVLERLAGDLPEGAVLVPCHDQAVAVLSRNRERLPPALRLTLPEADTVELLMDKDRLGTFARAHGLEVPALFRIHDAAEAREAAGQAQFPCVLKPSRRSRKWDAETTAKAFSIADGRELMSVYDRIRDWCEVVLLQELIPGGDDCLYSCNCYFDRQGRPVASFVARKLRQWPPRMGSSCLGEEVRNDTVRDESLRLLERANYRGLGYVEMKRDPRDGRHFLIEVNVGRPTGRSAIAEAGGVELLLAHYRDALGLPLPEALEQRYRGVKWWDFRHDCQSAFYYWRRGELGLARWLSSVRGRKAHAVFSWSDPLPFLTDLWRVLRLAISPGELRRRKAAFSGGRAGDDSH